MVDFRRCRLSSQARQLRSGLFDLDILAVFLLQRRFDTFVVAAPILRTSAQHSRYQRNPSRSSSDSVLHRFGSGFGWRPLGFGAALVDLSPCSFVQRPHAPQLCPRPFVRQLRPEPSLGSFVLRSLSFFCLLPSAVCGPLCEKSPSRLRSRFCGKESIATHKKFVNLLSALVSSFLLPFGPGFLRRFSSSTPFGHSRGGGAVLRGSAGHLRLQLNSSSSRSALDLSLYPGLSDWIFKFAAVCPFRGGHGHLPKSCIRSTASHQLQVLSTGGLVPLSPWISELEFRVHSHLRFAVVAADSIIVSTSAPQF